MAFRRLTGRFAHRWPVAYEQVARFFGFASLDLSGVARTACMFPWVDYIWSMEISTIWPIVVLVLTYFACRYAKKVDKWTYFAFLLIYLVFPSNSSAVLRYFNCVKFDARGRSPGTLKVLMADMSINCRSERYKLTSIFTWIMVAIYPIGIPVLCFATLFWYRKRINPTTTSDDMDEKISKRDNDRRLDRIRFLFEEYEPRYWWFAVVELIRRLYLTGLLAFFGSDEEPSTTTQTALGLLGAMVYYIVMAHFEPYVDDSDDMLAKVAAVQVIFTFFGATMLQARSNSDDEEAGDPQGVFQGAIFAAICVIVGLFTFSVALYILFSELSSTYAAQAASGNQYVGRISESFGSATNYLKKKVDSIGSAEDLANLAEEAKDDAAEEPDAPTSPLSPASPISPPLKAAL